MATSIQQPPSEYKDFKLVDHFTYLNYGTIYKYRSNKTGMYITLSKIQSPIMKAYLTVRTRPADHDGIPHVLEHLVFMGSEEYPYKGFLDRVANRCFAQGTNAYTQNTNTTYELTTAGKEGFYRLLPVYLDHILYPTLSDNAFMTEIHHIDGTGQNSGVVYNEMLGRENAPDELIYMLFNELMFEGSEGYQYNFGGRVSNLRELSVEKVRQFHKEYYCPQNFNVIVVGNTTVEELIDSVHESIEQKILKLQPNINPQLELNIWKQQLPPLTTSITKDIVYPSDEEDSGFYVTIGWRAGPWKDFFTSYALDIIWSVLTSGDIAPIRKEFVENENGDVWCGDVYASVDRTFENTHKIVFVNVEIDRFDSIVEKFYDFMRNVKIDLEYIKLVINRERLDSLRSYETSPHETFSSTLIEDFLYSTDNQDCRDVLEVNEISEQLANKDEQFWKDLINKFILSTESVVLRASPSAQKVKDIAEENNKRVEEQRNTLGEAKLKELETRLKQAEEINARPIDQKLLTEKFPIPTLDSIEEIHIPTFRNDNNPSFTQTEYDKELSQKLNNHITPLPFFLQITSIASRFVDMFCYMDSSNIPIELKMYIPLFLAINYSCDMKLGDEYIKKENVIMSLMRESVSNAYSCGADGHDEGSKNFHAGLFSDLVQFHLTFEIGKYEKMIDWVKNFLYNTVYTPELIETKIQVLLSEIQLYKITPEYVLAQGVKHMHISPQSNHSITSFLLQEQFLVQTLAKLKDDSNSVISELYHLRDTLNRPENIRVHITLDVDDFGPNNYEKITSPWYSLCKDSTNQVKPMDRLCNFSSAYTQPADRGILLGMGSTDSAFLIKVHNGISDYLNYHDRHSLSVAINFLCGEEGPFWVKLRGKGLCYGYTINSNVEKGIVAIYLSRVGNVSKAYEESKAIIEAICSDEPATDSVLILNEASLEPAKATTVVEKLNSAETIISASFSRFLTNTLFGGSRNFYENLQDIGKVTVSDVKRVIKQYLLPLFNDNEGSLFICDNTGKISNEYPIKDKLEKTGFIVTYTSLKEYLEKELGVTVSAPRTDMSCDEITEGAEDDEEEGDEDSMEDDE